MLQKETPKHTGIQITPKNKKNKREHKIKHPLLTNT